MGDIKNIDLKDRKILYFLDMDSRQSFSKISKRIGLHKDTVAKRVKKLMDKGVIQKFGTNFDYLKLGYIPLRFYFNFQYINKEKKDEIIQHFIDCEYSTQIAELDGSYDLLVLFLVKKIYDIKSFWDSTLLNYSDYFSNIIYSNYWGESIYPKSFLLDEKEKRSEIFKRVYEKNIDYDEIDIKILKLLSINARMPTIEIADHTSISSKTVHQRIKRLIKCGIIINFEVYVDWKKFGYQWFKIDISLKDYKKKYQIIKYIEQNPYLYNVDHTLGYVDLELELFLKNIDHLREIMEDITLKFSNSVRQYSYFNIVKLHKIFTL